MNYEDNILCIDPDLGAPMTVRLAPPGQQFPLDRGPSCGDGDILVEFYDRNFDHEPGFTRYGQFIGRYCATALIEGQGGPLILNSRVPQWSVDTRTMARVRNWLRESLREEGHN